MTQTPADGATTTPATPGTSNGSSTGTSTGSGTLATTGGSALETTGPLASEQGRTTIADVVVAKIAGIAAREVSGVHDLGGGAARAVGALRDRIPGSRTNLSQGVTVEVGERQAAVDLDLVAEFGAAIPDLATDVRRNVIESVEQMTGLEVTEVNITVHDVYVDDDGEDDTDGSSRRVE